jgi:uncharacterized protein (TIGR02118 family)
MITVNVVYPTQEGGTFDLEYYLSKHIPMVKERLHGALRGVTVEVGLANAVPGAPLPYVALCDLKFDSVAAFQGAFGPHAAEIQADIPKYTNITPVIQLSEVKL